ncbi:unnamed protein product [Sphenostylis stenocarpa]|uniref:Uncharacterized protein n=1 Tax=Sphenostylis stenocarpa TaxID=92480 RepID=A0AA86VYD5_9FABA|nr:unnamed protein product [Sphenostylis stenocarpa]
MFTKKRSEPESNAGGTTNLTVNKFQLMYRMELRKDPRAWGDMKSPLLSCRGTYE